MPRIRRRKRARRREYGRLHIINLECGFDHLSGAFGNCFDDDFDAEAAREAWGVLRDQVMESVRSEALASSHAARLRPWAFYEWDGPELGRHPQGGVEPGLRFRTANDEWETEADYLRRHGLFEPADQQIVDRWSQPRQAEA